MKESLDKFSLHLAFLNVRSLQAHFLDVKKDNKRAIKFYKKNGFKKFGTTKFGDFKGIIMKRKKLLQKGGGWHQVGAGWGQIGGGWGPSSILNFKGQSGGWGGNYP